MMMSLMTQTDRFDPADKRAHLLIVEDDSNTLQLMLDALEYEYGVQGVWNGVEALKALERESFDLVLLDIMMADIDGLEILRRIRETKTAIELPVILISALSQDTVIVEGLQSGANDYITKPFDIEVMRARIQCQLVLKKQVSDQGQTISDLKSSADMKDHFLHIASHDLKNPLNNLLLAHYQLRTVLGDQPEAKQALDTIEQTVNSMADLVDDFLDSAALENGRLELSLEAVEASHVISETLLAYEANANQKNISLRMGQTNGAMLADYNRLTQILSNLVSNAIKYTPPDRSVMIWSAVEGERVRIHVADQGPGIPADELDSLFKPFSKLSPRPTAGESSTGLGLWIAKELLRLQNGTIGVECPADGGSIFWCELPAY